MSLALNYSREHTVVGFIRRRGLRTLRAGTLVLLAIGALLLLTHQLVPPVDWEGPIRVSMHVRVIDATTGKPIPNAMFGVPQFCGVGPRQPTWTTDVKGEVVIAVTANGWGRCSPFYESTGFATASNYAAWAPGYESVVFDYGRGRGSSVKVCGITKTNRMKVDIRLTPTPTTPPPSHPSVTMSKQR